MGNAVKPRMSVRSALILVGIFGIAALIISVKGTPHKVQLPPDDDLYEHITLSVVFEPEKRVRPVIITAHVEGVPVVDGIPWYQSPFNQVVKIPKGAQVSLHVFQETSGNLDCIIMTHNGVAQPFGNAHRKDQGSVRCYHNRAAGS